MTEKENVKFLVGIESKFPVEQWNINGRFVWPIVRNIIATHNREGYIAKDAKSNKFSNRVYQFFEEVKIATKFPIYNPFARSSKSVLIFHDNSDRSILLNDGSNYDRFLDPFVDCFRDKNIPILNIEQSHYRKTVKTHYSVQCLDFIFLWVRIYNILCPQKGKVYLPQYNEFLNFVPSDLKNKLTIKNIQHEVGLIGRLSSIMKFIIKAHKVKLVVFECWYDVYRLAWSLACHDLGINAIDVQHGRGGSTGHDFYAEWTKFPDNGKYEMMPNIFWTWTHEDKKAIDSWNTNIELAYNGGKPINMVIERIRKNINISNLEKLSSNLPVILITLQWGTVYPKWFINFIKENNEKYNWLIRCHPVKDVMQYNFIKDVRNISNVYIDGIENLPIELLLEYVNVHVTSSSSVIVDAAMVGKSSIMINQKFEKSFSKYIEKNILITAFNANGLQEAIKMILDKKIVNKERVSTDANLKYLLKLLEKK